MLRLDGTATQQKRMATLVVFVGLVNPGEGILVIGQFRRPFGKQFHRAGGAQERRSLAGGRAQEAAAISA